jgi:hypothetical protein|mmetsp:Transcript_26529/g.4644  ORF Transcript_26529/g.4644 Transcript_26529/m.4644 type:complete len:106 (+) Transcript_26529:1946-2263(+)
MTVTYPCKYTFASGAVLSPANNCDLVVGSTKNPAIVRFKNINAAVAVGSGNIELWIPHMKNNLRGLKYNIEFKVVTKDSRGVPIEEAEWKANAGTIYANTNYVDF